MIKEEYFEDETTQKIAKGLTKRVVNQRFTLLKLPVGYGKTIIAVQTAVNIAKKNNDRLQIGVIAPKSKRLDKSFDEALEVAEKMYDIKFNRLLINNNEVGTFSGLVHTSADREAEKALIKQIKKEPTLIILDETHMTLRDSTSKTSKGFLKILKAVENKQFVRVVGLTATPFDTSILDSIGYMVFNGTYNSRTAFYREELVNYSNIAKKGVTQSDVASIIIGEDYVINKRIFKNIYRVLDNLRPIIYHPVVKRNFHIPENKIYPVKVDLTDEDIDFFEQVENYSSLGGFSSSTEKRIAFIEAMTINKAFLNAVLEICKSKEVFQPIIFYQYNSQREALIDMFTANDITFLQVNGHNHDFFSTNDTVSPILVQYLAGATAFESKDSNTSIYFSLPDSSVVFEQSLGRNTRRNQQFAYVNNYILQPYIDNVMITEYIVKYNRILDKMTQNNRFLKALESEL